MVFVRILSYIFNNLDWFYLSSLVKPVDHGGTALAILSKTSEKFDLVLIDSNLSDVDAHKFLKITRNMDIQAICEFNTHLFTSSILYYIQ